MNIYEVVAKKIDDNEGMSFSYEPKDSKVVFTLYLDEYEFNISGDVYNFIHLSENEKPTCPWFDSVNKEFLFEIPVLYSLQFIEKFLSTNNKKRGNSS